MDVKVVEMSNVLIQSLLAATVWVRMRRGKVRGCGDGRQRGQKAIEVGA